MKAATSHRSRPERRPGLVASLTGVVALALALAWTGACAKNPVSGRPQPVVQTEKREIEQGKQAAEQVEEQMGLVEDPELSAYVSAIGARLVAQSQRSELEFAFHVVDMKAPNAFALPGGHIYVSRGLLALLNSEDELANVIGHEIGHVSARHSVGRQTANVPLIPIRVATGLAGGVTSIVAPGIGSLVTNIGKAPGALMLAKYSRSQEREADRLGQSYAAAAGWDPAGLASFMHSLAREEALEGNDPDRTDLLASHPSSPERSKAAAENAASLTITPDRPKPLARASFFERLDSLTIGDSAAGGIFDGEAFLHPELGFGFDVPEGWDTANLPSAVVAQHPDGQSQVVLSVVAEGHDPMSAAREFGEKNRFEDAPRRSEVNGLDAVTARLELGSFRNRSKAIIAWIALDDLVYRVSGTAPSGSFDTRLPRFQRSIDSFHAIGEAERARIFEDRLRIAPARAGESIEQLSGRTENTWSAERTAVANGLEEDAVFEPEQLVKVARREVYARRGNGSPRDDVE